MASHDNLNSESPKSEHIITEFFSKSLHIILESRAPFVSSRNFSGEQVPSSPSSSSTASPGFRPRDRWFNLVLRDCFPAVESFDVWSQHGREMLVIDILLIQRSACESPKEKTGLSRNPSLKTRFFSCCGSGDEDLSFSRQTVAERWVVQYEKRQPSSRELNLGGSGHEKGRKGAGSRLGKGRGSIAGEPQNYHASSHESRSYAYKKMGKRLNISLRSLYVTVRLLPAYRIFKVLNSSSRIYSLGLGYKVTPFVEPFSREEEAEMQLFTFAPIETPCGRLSLSVWYHPSLSDIKLEPSFPSSPRLIMGYVGSPIADPLKRFASGSFNLSGKKGGTNTAGLPFDSPSSTVPFARRHSWSNDLNKALYSNSPPSHTKNTSASPSPILSDSRPSCSDPSAQQLPSHRQLNVDYSSSGGSPAHPLDMPKVAGFDEYWPSLFSRSPSPSPPIHQYFSRALFRCESAPLTISSTRACKSHGLPTHNSHDRNCNLPPSPSPKRATSSGPSQGGGRSSVKPDELRDPHIIAPTLPTCSSQKVLLSGKENSGGLCGVRVSANNSPQISVSRSSSRLPFQDESDDCEFSCPFAIDDDAYNRSESFGRKGTGEAPKAGQLSLVRKSDQAVVGELIQMLQNAAPLRQDKTKLQTWDPQLNQAGNMSNVQPSYASNVSDSGVGSSILLSKTKADAMEELKSYSKIKDLLLRQGGT